MTVEQSQQLTSPPAATGQGEGLKKPERRLNSDRVPAAAPHPNPLPEGQGAKYNRINRVTLRRAKHNRTEATWPERMLWSRLRARRSHGLKWRQQHPIDHFIVDFCCLSHHLIIEIDGETYVGRAKEDQRRSAYLESKGFRVIRVTNDEVIHDLDTVLQFIKQETNLA